MSRKRAIRLNMMLSNAIQPGVQVAAAQPTASQARACSQAFAGSLADAMSATSVTAGNSGKPLSTPTPDDLKRGDNNPDSAGEPMAGVIAFALLPVIPVPTLNNSPGCASAPISNHVDESAAPTTFPAPADAAAAPKDITSEPFESSAPLGA